MDDSDALYMARRVMRRNLERAQDAQSICDSELIRAIIMESWLWLNDFDLPRCTHDDGAVQFNPYNNVTQCHKCGKVMNTADEPGLRNRDTAATGTAKE